MVVLFVWSSFLILYKWLSNCEISLPQFDTLVCTNTKCGNYYGAFLQESPRLESCIHKNLKLDSVSYLNRSIQDLMDHGTSKELKNPLPEYHDPRDLNLICLVKKCKIHFWMNSILDFLKRNAPLIGWATCMFTTDHKLML